MSIAYEQPESFAFTAENMELAQSHIAKYPAEKKASACMPLLDLAQRQHDGWLPRAAMDHVAEILEMPPVRVYEVATFYTMYNKEPVGKHHVQVCTNISCWLRGADQIVEAVVNEVGAPLGTTSDDGLFKVIEVECLGACTNAPMMQINDDFYEDMQPEDAARIIAELRDGKQPKTGPQNGRQTCEPLGGPNVLKD